MLTVTQWQPPPPPPEAQGVGYVTCILLYTLWRDNTAPTQRRRRSINKTGILYSM